MSNNWINHKPRAPWVAGLYKKAKEGVQDALNEHRAADRETTLARGRRIDDIMGRQAHVAGGSHVDTDPNTEDVIVLYDQFHKDVYHRRLTLVERMEEGRQVVILQGEANGITSSKKVDAGTTELLASSEQKIDADLHRADILSDWHYMEDALRETELTETEDGRLTNPWHVPYGSARIHAGSYLDDNRETLDVIMHDKYPGPSRWKPRCSVIWRATQRSSRARERLARTTAFHQLRSTGRLGRFFDNGRPQGKSQTLLRQAVSSN